MPPKQTNSVSPGTVIFVLALATGIISAFAFTTDNSTTMATLAFLSNYTGSDTDAFGNAVVAMANTLGVSANDLMFVMDNETNHTLSPSIKNSLGYVGLIQFSADSAALVGTTQAALAQMSAVQQLAYVQKYFQYWIGKLGTPQTTADTYLMVFYPAAVNQPNTYQFPANVVAANPEFFSDPLSTGTKQDFINWLNGAIPSAYSGLFTNVG